jgi:serine/threonine protein kinase
VKRAHASRGALLITTSLLIGRSARSMQFHPRMLACPRCGAAYANGFEYCSLDGARLVVEDADFMVGHLVDHYQLVERIAEGGTGRVYLARDIFTRREVAIKLLYGHLAKDRTASVRFKREAIAASFIHHPNVISVYHQGTSAEGLCFMVMEYLRGRTLADALRTYGRLPIPHALDIARQIAQGLAAAHSMNFVHRDLKPSNIMLVDKTRAMHVKILDFGLVGQSMDGEIAAARLTSPGQVFGTPAYMAPEQIMGGRIDARTDLYALGVVLYEMISGAPPFCGDVKQVLCQHMAVPPRPLHDAGPVGVLALHLLEKNPDQRPSSARSVIDRIEHLELAYALAASPPGTSRHPAALRPTPEPQGGYASPKTAPAPLFARSRARRKETIDHAVEGRHSDERRSDDDEYIRAALGRGSTGRWGLFATMVVGAAITIVLYALGSQAQDAKASPPARIVRAESGPLTPTKEWNASTLKESKTLQAILAGRRTRHRDERTAPTMTVPRRPPFAARPERPHR